MMHKSHAPILVVLLLFPLPLISQGDSEVFWEGEVTAGRSITWENEIDLLLNELAGSHPDLFFLRDRTSFSAELRSIASQAGNSPPFPIAVKLQQAVARLGDDQTRVNFHYFIDKSFILPLECYWFEEGIYVLKTMDQYHQLLGKRIVSINGYPVGQVIDSLATLVPGVNPSLVLARIPQMITWAQLLNHFGFGSTRQAEVVAEDGSGGRSAVTLSLPPAEGHPVSFDSGPLPRGWEDRITYFRDQYFPGEGLYFLQYNKCWSREAEEEFGSGASALFMPLFKEFEKRVFRTLQEEQVGKLVIDLRFNDGGNPEQGTAFIEKLLKKRYTQHTALYLVLGRNTSSEAMVHAVDLLNNGSAVSVGEATGGWINYFGDERRFVLPESGLVINCSTRRFKLLEDGDHPLEPEHYAPMTFEAYSKGIDPPLVMIIKDLPK